MTRIENISIDPLQQHTIVLPDGTSFAMTLYFISMQYGWFITNLTYNDFVLNGLRVCDSPNMLHQFRNQVPFGLACITKGNREPTQLQDFSSLNSSLYLLSEDEVEAYEEFLSGGS